MVNDLFEVTARDSHPLADSGGRGLAHAAPASALAPSYPSSGFYTPHPATAPSHLRLPSRGLRGQNLGQSSRESPAGLRCRARESWSGCPRTAEGARGGLKGDGAGEMPSLAPRSRAPGRSRAEGPEGGSAVHDAASTHFLAPRDTAAPSTGYPVARGLVGLRVVRARRPRDGPRQDYHSQEAVRARMLLGGVVQGGEGARQTGGSGNYMSQDAARRARGWGFEPRVSRPLQGCVGCGGCGRRRRPWPASGSGG